MDRETAKIITAGVWIDHRKAMVVLISGVKEETIEIRSDAERQPRHMKGTCSTAPCKTQTVKTDDCREQEVAGPPNGYYADVIAAIGAAGAILIFGPDEVKDAFKKYLDLENFGGKVVSVQPYDTMTDRQIAAKMREYFHR